MTRSRGLILLFLLLAGCSGEPQSRPVRLSIATGTTTGVYYPLGNAVARLWSQKIPNVLVSAQATSASVQNMNLLRSKEADVAFTLNSIAIYAFEGKDFFQGRPQPELRGITHLYPNLIQVIVRADAAIHSFRDLEKKRFIPGAVGSGTEVNSREICGIYGLNYWDADTANVKADYVGFTEAVELLKNGHADAALISAGIPNAALLELSTSSDVRLLSLDGPQIEEIVRQYPAYFPATIPANTYPNQDHEVRTVAQANLLVTRADLEEDLVYHMTRTLYEGLAELASAHAAARTIVRDDALKGMGPLPLHAGAARYYRETGVLK